MSVTTSPTESIGQAPPSARPRRVRDRRHARHRRGDLPQPRRAGGGRRGRLQPRPRNGRGVRRQAHREHLKGSIHQGNIGSAEDCRRTVAEVIEQHGRLDILVNNAGITIDKTRPEDDRRGLVQGDRGQPVRRVLHEPGGAAAHDRARLGTDREHLLDHRRDGQHRPGELRGFEVGAVRADQDARAARLRTSSSGPASSRRTASGSPSTRSPPGSSRPRCSSTSPRRCLTGSRRRSRWDGSEGPTRSRASCISWSRISPRSSPARSGASTAGWTCERRVSRGAGHRRRERDRLRDRGARAVTLAVASHHACMLAGFLLTCKH